MSRFKDHSNMSNITAGNRFPNLLQEEVEGEG